MKEETQEAEVLEEAATEEKAVTEEKTVTEKKKKEAKPKKAKTSKESSQMVNYEKEEVENLIIKLSQKSLTASEIGAAMRDQYGIPDTKAFGFTVGKVLKKHGAGKDIPEDLYNLLKKSVLMRSHLDKNKKDKKGIHTLQLVESRVRKLGRYYSKIGKMPKDWKYDASKAKLIVK